MIDIRIDGFESVLDMFRGIPNEIKQLDNLADAYLYSVEGFAKILSPVDTGTLRRSIHTWRGGFASGYVATNTDYALYVHEGYGSNRYKGSRPFMTWGVENANYDLELLIDKFLSKLVR